MIPPRFQTSDPTPVLSVQGWNDLTIARFAGGVMIRNPSGCVVVPAEAVEPLRDKLAELDAEPRLTPRRDEYNPIPVAPGVALSVFGDGDVVIHVGADGPAPGATVGLDIGEIGRVVKGLG